jgi:hypothetical protein
LVAFRMAARLRRSSRGRRVADGPDSILCVGPLPDAWNALCVCKAMRLGPGEESHMKFTCFIVSV